MLYVNDKDLTSIETDWQDLVRTLESVVYLIDSGDFTQPVKPYLRYNNPKNRIIAMPAYVGGNLNIPGIKWIASFPDNFKRGLPRAHSVIILNDPDTGVPTSILNSPLPSIVRTASVSGMMIQHFLQARSLVRFNVGIIGWGPIGKHHLKMAIALFGDRIEHIRIYDIKGVDFSEVSSHYKNWVSIEQTWEDVYRNSDIFITCTASNQRYINSPPRKGTLMLNVSLRDYKREALSSLNAVVVDDWDEVCRENTDIELLHLEQGLARTDVQTIADVVCRRSLSMFDIEEPIFFCPMGMAVFDIATADYYIKLARVRGLGMELE